MAIRIFLPRALDANGDVVSDATAYFFTAGSSTPLTVYEESSLSTSRGTSLAATSSGAFASCWVDDGVEVKVDVQDSEGASIPGYPNDYNGTFPEVTGQASSTVFTPSSPNTGTNVQGAIEQNIARLNAFDNATRLPTSTGSGGAFAISTVYAITAYAEGQEFEFVANHAGVGSGTDRLNVDGVGAVVLKKFSGSTTKTDLDAGDISIGDVVQVKYDGSHFVVTSRGKVSVTDIAPAALVTEGEGIAAEDNDTTIPTSAAVKDYADTAVAAIETGWEYVEALYDQAVDGTAAGPFESTDFADGFDYRILVDNQSGSGSHTFQMDFYKETDDAYSGYSAIATSIGSSVDRFMVINLWNPKQSSHVHFLEEYAYNGGVGSDSYDAGGSITVGSIVFATAQPMSKIRIRPSSGNFDDGKIIVQRRPSALS